MYTSTNLQEELSHNNQSQALMNVFRRDKVHSYFCT
ncbi:hypothetical protein Pint_09827 [Pistacia integerrima]|uniref:Uncharacterized protein n=1 Tax=Pistacia integerrima TaxID=434235 RepID=A0ACC0XH11_9ROSI|nr:hypothetical protein Pint_09827 [Pistacia integerrima]